MGRIRVQASQTLPEFVVWPRGTYELLIESVEETVAKSSGNTQLKIKIQAMSGPLAGKANIHFLAITPKTGGFVRELVDAAGIDANIVELEEINPEDGKAFIEIDFDTDDLPGKSLLAECTIENDQNGEPRNRFRRFRPLEAVEAPAPAATRRAAPVPAPQAGVSARGRTAAPAPAQGAATRRTRTL